jgi:hypothetical protein
MNLKGIQRSLCNLLFRKKKEGKDSRKIELNRKSEDPSINNKSDRIIRGAVIGAR